MGQYIVCEHEFMHVLVCRGMTYVMCLKELAHGGYGELCLYDAGLASCPAESASVSF